MSAELREKLAAAIAAAKFDEDDYVDPDHLSRAVLVVVESAIESALAVRTEALVQEFRKLARDFPEAAGTDWDTIEITLGKFTAQSDKAWLAHFKAEIGTAALTDLARDGKDLIMGCGEPFRAFSEAALARHDQQVRQAALREGQLQEHDYYCGSCTDEKHCQRRISIEVELKKALGHLGPQSFDHSAPAYIPTEKFDHPGPEEGKEEHPITKQELEIAELRSPMPCGHPKACRVHAVKPNCECDENTGSEAEYCTVCCELAELRESLQFCLEHLPDPTEEDNDAYIAGYALAKQRVTLQTRTGSDHE